MSQTSSDFCLRLPQMQVRLRVQKYRDPLVWYWILACWLTQVQVILFYKYILAPSYKYKIGLLHKYKLDRFTNAKHPFCKYCPFTNPVKTSPEEHLDWQDTVFSLWKAGHIYSSWLTDIIAPFPCSRIESWAMPEYPWAVCPSSHASQEVLQGTCHTP